MANSLEKFIKLISSDSDCDLSKKVEKLDKHQLNDFYLALEKLFDRINLDPKELNKGTLLGVGSFGYAFEVSGGKVLKITSDELEANNSALIKGEKVPLVCEIYEVFGFKKIKSIFVIIQKKYPNKSAFTNPNVTTEDYLSLQIILRQQVSNTAKKFWGGDLIFDYDKEIKKYTKFFNNTIQNFKPKLDLKIGEQFDKDVENLLNTKEGNMTPIERSDFLKIHEIVRMIFNPSYFDSNGVFENELDVVLHFYAVFKILQEYGIEFADFHGGNLLNDNGELVVIDLGQSKSDKKGQINVIENTMFNMFNKLLIEKV